MRIVLAALALILGPATSAATPTMVRIDDQPAGATGLVNAIALLADVNEGGLKAASATGVTQLIDQGNVRAILCNASACYFGVNQNFTSGRLWRSDGTPAGTRIVADFPNGGIAVQALAGDLIYVQVGGTDPRVVEVDATGVVRVIFAGYSNGDLVANTEVVAFSTNQELGGMIRIDRGQAPIQLGRYVSNGRSKPAAVIGDTVIFAMETPATGTELWRHRRGDVAPTLIRDFSPGPTGSGPDLITPFGDGVYLRTAIGMFSLAPPFTNPVQVSGLGLPFRMQAQQGRLAIEGSGGGFRNAYLIPAYGSPVISLSSFSAGSFVPFEREVFGFVGSGIVFGANATVTGPVNISLGREPYYSDYSGGPAILLADLVPGSSDSDPRAMSSDGRRAVFSAAGSVWLVGAALGGQLMLPQPVPGLEFATRLLLALSIMVSVWLLARKH